ncbi:MAG: hypothetical protein AB7O45_16890 [Alphaproteobacteria bacterium]
MRGASAWVVAAATMLAAHSAAADMTLTLQNGTTASVGVSYGQWGEILAPNAMAVLDVTISGLVAFRFHNSNVDVCRAVTMLYYKDAGANCVVNEWVTFSPRCVAVIEGNGSARCSITVSLAP